MSNIEKPLERSVEKRIKMCPGLKPQSSDITDILGITQWRLDDTVLTNHPFQQEIHQNKESGNTSETFYIGNELFTLEKGGYDSNKDGYAVFNQLHQKIGTAAGVLIGDSGFGEIYWAVDRQDGKDLHYGLKTMFEIFHVRFQSQYGIKMRIIGLGLTDYGSAFWQSFFRTGNAVNTDKGMFFVPDSEKKLFNGNDASLYESMYDVKVGRYISFFG